MVINMVQLVGLDGIDPRLKEREWERADNYAGEDLTGYYVVYSHNRDSTRLKESNWDTLIKQFKDNPRFEIHLFNHWLCGWVECIMIDGSKMTIEDYNEILKIINDLEDYPVLDEEDYSNREYESTLENMDNELSYALSDLESEGLRLKDSMDSKDICKKVFRWLWDNDQQQLEDIDDSGGFPSKDSIKNALKAINILEEYTEYMVYVGNIGNVLKTEDKEIAYKTYNEYIEQSKANYGRASKESVTLWLNGEIMEEYEGEIDKRED